MAKVKFIDRIEQNGLVYEIKALEDFGEGSVLDPMIPGRVIRTKSWYQLFVFRNKLNVKSSFIRHIPKEYADGFSSKDEDNIFESEIENLRKEIRFGEFEES